MKGWSGFKGFVRAAAASLSCAVGLAAMAAFAPGCGGSACGEKRDTPNCVAALEAAAEEYAAALCRDKAECYPGYAERTYGPEAKCTERVAQAYKNWLQHGGVLVTPEELKACAEALDAPDCDVEASGNEACRFEGAKGDGAPCTLDMECQSWRCDYEGDGACGVCRSVRLEGEPCDPEMGDCDFGLTCEVSNTCHRRVGEGKLCGSTDECGGNLVCAASKCSAPLGAGAPCTYDECDEGQGLWCNSKTSVCDTMVIAPSGGFCGYADDGRLHWCDYGLWCDSEKCAPRAIDGQSCAAAPCIVPALCHAGTCTLDPPVCE